MNSKQRKLDDWVTLHLWRHNCWDETFLLTDTRGEDSLVSDPDPSWPWHFNRSTLAALGLGLLLFTHKYTFYSVHLFQIFTYRYKLNVSESSQSASPLVFPPIWILPWVTWDGNVRSQADVDQDNPDKCDELDKFQVKIINNYPW